ncbi:hypothetical protein MKW94_028462, partial [Papaver nudicaule]|nr:hypothetical protein [Papaver nudicaule]
MDLALDLIEPVISPSPYVFYKAIFEVGEVIQFYDSDKCFPAWGFGGRPSNDVVSHCFNLNGSSSEEVEGVSGIMSAYSSALQNYSLHGPTLFGKVINRAAQIAAESLHNQTKYFVLLILTDGVVTDLQETIDSLVRASDLPLSILIIGVGGADFKDMEILDADNGNRLQSSTGQLATRDIVQFVPMREGNQLSVVQSLLEELPGQFLTHMRSRDIKPLLISQPKASEVCNGRITPWSTGSALSFNICIFVFV